MLQVYFFMNNKNIHRRIFIIIVLLAAAVVSLYIFKYNGASEPFTEVSRPVEEKTAIEIQKEVTDIAAYRGSYVTGFEEDMLLVQYELRYKPTVIAVDALGPTIYIHEKNKNKTHTITIFYNGAAGFSSTQHFWEETHICPECTRINPTIDIGESKDLIMYTDGQKEWAVFERVPGFVVAEYLIGSGTVKDVMSSLNMTVTPAAANQ